MNKWTNTHDILRDLCEAQGDVPIDVIGTIGAEDKPPPLDIKEETEEAYFVCSGEGPVSAPDLRLIQEMLNIVRNNPAGSDSDEPKNPVTVTPYNPLPQPLIITKPKKLPQNNQASKPDIQVSKTAKASKKKKNNNVAMNSIINQNADTLTLVKPDDLQTNTDSKTETKDPVKTKKKPAVLLEPPTNMFRKKCNVKTSNSTPNSSTSVSPCSSKESFNSPNDSSSCSKVSSNCSKASPNCSKVFVPSSFAVEYMNKLKEKAKLKETIVEDVWAKAMNQMKAIEEKRKKDLESAARSKNNGNGSDDDTSSQEGEDEYDRSEPFDPMEMLKLPRHRHFLDKNCVICSVFQKREILIYNRGDNK